MSDGGDITQPIIIPFLAQVTVNRAEKTGRVMVSIPLILFFNA